MFEALNQEILEAKEKLYELDRYERRLGQCKAELKEATAQYETLGAELKKDEHQLERLQGVSLAHLFHLVLHTQDEKEREVQKEIARVKLQHDTLEATIANLNRDITRLSKYVEEIRTVKADYAHLLEEKQGLVLSSGLPEARELLNVIHAIADLRSDIKESKEALHEAEIAQGTLSECLTSLNKAETWGGLDMFGGGDITTMIKRGHMRDAQALINDAQYALQRLERELKDIRVQERYDIEVGGFLGFSDYFFDGFFVDWAVQKRLEQSTDNVSTILSSVNRVEVKLKERIRHDMSSLNEAEKKRVAMLERG